jgi:2-iminobutanoate/2-iminopropanoate deaminase
MEDVMSQIEKQTVKVAGGPAVIGPYSLAVKAGDFLYTSGQLGLDAASENLVEGGVEAETRQALTNLKKILQAGGSSLASVVKTTVFMRDMADFAKMNAVYAEFFTGDCPARSAVQVAALPKNAAVEIEAVAINH